jgi:hypothetical protein
MGVGDRREEGKAVEGGGGGRTCCTQDGGSNCINTWRGERGREERRGGVSGVRGEERRRGGEEERSIGSKRRGGEERRSIGSGSLQKSSTEVIYRSHRPCGT